jgi:KDO2-lipid IV(A) lauroyltransferase
MKHSFTHYIEYVAMLMFQTVIRLLPLRAVVVWADLTALVVGTVFRPRNNIVMKNLAIAFPEMKTRDMKKIRNMSYRNILMSSFESYKYMFLTSSQKLEHLIIDEDSKQALFSANRLGNGCIVVGGHYGFFEAGGHYANCNGIKSAYVVANQKNKLTEKLIDLPREKAGILVIHRKQMTRLFRSIKDNYFIALLSDQNAGHKHGIFVDFFGIPASTHKNPAVISLKYNIPMLFVNTVRDSEDRTKHHLSFTEVKFDDIMSMDVSFEDKVTVLVQRYTHILEDRIRENPFHYWWIHKRFKTRPEKKVNFYK